MKLLLSDLYNQPLSTLYICSLEQALYQARVLIDNTEHVIWETDNKVLLTRSLNTMREKVSELDIQNLILRQESPYDEMVGQAVRTASNRMEVPLGKTMYNN